MPFTYTHISDPSFPSAPRSPEQMAAGGREERGEQVRAGPPSARVRALSTFCQSLGDSQRFANSQGKKHV